MVFDLGHQLHDFSSTAMICEHWAVRCRATALRSSYRHFCLVIEVDVTQLLRKKGAVAQLASPLAYFFISPESFPVPPFLSTVYRTLYHAHPHTFTSTHTYPYCFIPSLASNVYQLALVLEIEPLTETILHAQRKQKFVLGARGGHIT